MNSILQNEHKCYVCGTIFNLELHHIYGGGNRKISDKNGFVCYLCHTHHTTDIGVHFDNELMNRLHRDCQKKYEETHTRADFMRLIGRNYL